MAKHTAALLALTAAIFVGFTAAAPAQYAPNDAQQAPSTKPAESSAPRARKPVEVPDDDDTRSGGGTQP